MIIVESKDEDRRLPLEAATLDIFRLLKGRGYSTRSANSWIDANMRRIQDLLDANYDSAEDIVREIEGSSAESRVTKGKTLEQVRKELNDIADLWVGNDYGDDKERALADARTAVAGTEYEDAARAVLDDAHLMEMLTVAEAIELILSELHNA